MPEDLKNHDALKARISSKLFERTKNEFLYPEDVSRSATASAVLFLLGVTFLGPMPSQDLRMFKRVLYPMVVWVNRQHRFLPNWEVEGIVRVPLRKLLEPDAYAVYRIRFQDPGQWTFTRDFPCFRHEKGKEKEILWGVTYRIVMVFLDIVFDFKPPLPECLPVIQGAMNEHYLNGAG